MGRVHYPRVARMLQVETAPDELISSPNYEAARVFARNAARSGLPVSKIPMPIDWNFALAELRGEMKPSYTNGDGALGVNNGGKHSVDVTYIAAAEATGLVNVETLHRVTDVERAADGRWRVYVDRTDISGKILENKILTTDALVMAAGSMNTTKLLVRAAATGADHGSAGRARRRVGDQCRSDLHLVGSRRELRCDAGRAGRLRQPELGRPA